MWLRGGFLSVHLTEKMLGILNSVIIEKSSVPEIRVSKKNSWIKKFLMFYLKFLTAVKNFITIFILFKMVASQLESSLINETLWGGLVRWVVPEINKCWSLQIPQPVSLVIYWVIETCIHLTTKLIFIFPFAQTEKMADIRRSTHKGIHKPICECVCDCRFI